MVVLSVVAFAVNYVAAAAAAAASNFDFAAVVQELNAVDPNHSVDPVPYTHSLTDDLQVTYARELAQVRRALPRKIPKAERAAEVSRWVQEQNRHVAIFLAGSGAGSANLEGMAIAQRIFRELAVNPVTRVDQVSRYDAVGDVGFCFGRAAFVHLQLLRAHVRPADIAKIFLVGRLRHERQLWEYHMATMLRTAPGQWLVIDSLFAEPLPHAEWMRQAAKMDINSKLPQSRFYVTDARKFQAAYPAYRSVDFEIPELRMYFADLFRSLGQALP